MSIHYLHDVPSTIFVLFDKILYIYIVFSLINLSISQQYNPIECCTE